MIKFKFFLKELYINIISPIFIALIIAILLRIFVFNILYIVSSSMEDTLKVGDIVLAWKFLYNKRIYGLKIKMPFGFKINRGDIIIFEPPVENDKERTYVKRCIGLPGDEIILNDDKVIVNKKILNEDYVKGKGLAIYVFQKLKVPNGFIYVLGDNRLNSNDSRNFGFVPQENIIGKVVLIIYPINRFRILK